ncbi:MAG: AMP-binding protein [Chloroflexi bacterium]|nr:AMP-binding protein [Chloroflexota bacterium]
MNLDEKLRDIVAYAYEHALAVRARFEAAELTPADIQTTADLVRLPILSKDELIALQQANPPFGGMLGVPASEVTRIYMSPGPIYEPAPEPTDTAWEMAVAVLRGGGFTADDIVLNTLSYHLVPAGLLLDEALLRVGATVVPSGYGNTDLQVKLLRDLGVTGYVGTPSFLAHLLQRAEELGLNVRRDLKLNKVLVSAEPLPPSLRQKFADEYGLAVCNTYATAELGLLAYNTTPGLTMDLLPEPIIELVDPDTGELVGTGEVGEIVVTGFSKVYPLIRLGTGDLAINVDPLPGESVQEERQIIIVGRRGDALKVRGMFVHPTQLRFAVTQAAMMAGVYPPPAVQGVVTRPDPQRDFLTVRVATAENPALDDALRGAIQQACRVRVDAIVFVDVIDEGERMMVDGRAWD